MARKRKTYQEQTRVENPTPETVPVLEWPSAIYARLSIENSGKDDNGDSIENQVEICRCYLEEHPYLHLFDVYTDNGWTGTNTKRPEFQRMLDDVNAEKVKAVIIKDFSRFSRDYIEAGNLLENVFPSMGVRFISVADGYDSFETDGTAESLLIPLKNLINSYYSKDISRKVSTAVHSQQLAGKHLPSQIPYGYRKSETREYRMEPDPETAWVVKRIFREYYETGVVNAIARQLDAEGIPSPGQIRYNRGQTVRPCYQTSRWSTAMIKQILKNPTYMGDMVFGRMPTALYLGQPDYHYEPDETKWRVLPDTHEPLVDREIFYAIKERLTVNRKAYEERVKGTEAFRMDNPMLFKGIIFCGDCGGSMAFTRSRLKSGGAYCSYHCLRQTSKQCSSTHTISQERLKQVVWDAMQDQFAYFCDFQELAEEIGSQKVETSEQSVYQNKIRNVLMKIQRCMDKRENLYEDFTDNTLSAEDYTLFKEKYDEEYQSLNRELNHLQTMQSRLNRSLSHKNQWLVHMQTMQDANELTTELLHALVEKILIYQNGNGIRVEVVFNYREDFEVLEKAYDELKGACEI